MRTYPYIVFLFALGGACTVDVAPHPCEIDSNCNLAAGGTCELYSPSGETWCQYPDANCPSGRRWSDYATYPDISGQCVGDGPPIDAGFDAPRVDAGFDAAPADAARPDADPGAEFAIRWGGTSVDYSQALAVDSRGDTFAVGVFTGTANFGGQSLTSAGYGDICVAKYSRAGGLIWVKRFGGADSDSADAVTVDDSDNVILSAYVTNNLFIAKLAGIDGATLWQRAFAGSGVGKGLATNTNGDVLLTGNFTGTLNLGGIPLTSNGGSDVFVARLRASDGTPEQARRYGSAGAELVTALDVDTAGSLWLSGTFANTTVDFGGGPLTASGTDMFLLKLDAAGSHLWSRSLTATGIEVSGKLRAAPAGGIVVAGGFYGNLTTGAPSPLVSAGNQDIFVARYDATGQHVFSLRFGSGASGVEYATAVHARGDNLVVAGSFSGPIDFGGGARTGTHFFLGLSPTDGGYRWVRVYSGPFQLEVNEAALDPAGGVFAIGSFRLTFDFGLATLTSAGDYDGFLLHFFP